MNPLRSGRVLIMLTFSLFLTACSNINGPTPPATSTQQTPPTLAVVSTALPQAEVPVDSVSSSTIYAYTNLNPDGNRYITGQGKLPELTPVDIVLGGSPLWLLSAPYQTGVVWVAIMADGAVQAFATEGDQVTIIPVLPENLSPSTPSVLRVQDSELTLLAAPAADASLVTAPAVLLSSETLVYVADNGDLVFWRDGEIARLAVNALLDTRLLVDEHERILLLTDPTTEYGHGVLGDAVEANTVTVVTTAPEFAIERVITAPEETVIEGLAPIWADLNGDGVREIIVTASNAVQGAQIIAYNDDGTLYAEGPAIGQGSRWRNQLAVAPFAPDGGMELADVLTPHIGGVVEFFDNADLQRTAHINGYTTHVYGTRNLDMGLAGDFNGDGRPEVLVPTQDRQQLAGVQRNPDGAAPVYTLPAGGRIATNITAAALPDGSLAVGIATEAGVLRVWTP